MKTTPIIDFHTHAFPDTLAPRAIAQLTINAAASGYVPMTDGTVAGLQASMDQAGIHRSVICNIATNGRQMAKVNEFACLIELEQTEIHALGSLHPDGKNLEGQIKLLKSAGIKGIKLQPDYIRTDFDNPSLHPIFELCIAYDMFVITHAGFDPGSRLHVHCRPRHIRKVMENFPNLTLIAAHMGGIGCEKDTLEMLCGTPIYFDTALSGRFSERQPLLYQIMQKHDTSRILYGSDCPWSNQEYEQSFVKNAPISEQAKEDIFWNNAARLLGLSK